MLDISYIPRTFNLFNDVPLTTGIHVYCVAGGGDPISDSPYPNLDGWWNVIQFGYSFNSNSISGISGRVRVQRKRRVVDSESA